MKQPVVENEIRKIIFSVYDDAFLTRLETEAFPKFQQELLQVSEQGFFNIAFRNDIFGLETEKLKRIGGRVSAKAGCVALPCCLQASSLSSYPPTVRCECEGWKQSDGVIHAHSMFPEYIPFHRKNVPTGLLS